MASDWCSEVVSVTPVENLTTDTIGNFVVEVNGDTSFLQINRDTVPTSLSLETVASIEQTVIVVDNLCENDLVTIDEGNKKRRLDTQESSQEMKSHCSSAGNENVSLTRKSERERKGRRAYSPTPVAAQKGGKRKKQGGIVRKREGLSSSDLLLGDKGPGGKMFCCDLCKSPYICNPTRRGYSHGRRPKSTPNPRYRIHPSTGRVLTLCNACGLCLGRVRAPKPPKPPALSGVEKQSYLQEAERFGESLAERLGDPDAKRLYCPKVKNKPCGCVQNFITGDGSDEMLEARGQQLLHMYKEAKILSLEKWQSEDEQSNPVGGSKKKSRAVGLGNGKRKSRAFEDFVLTKRAYLKEDLGLCEHAIQLLLVYSNNFLHKRLKTRDSRFRASRSKGKAALGTLVPIIDLPRLRCCMDNCVMMALTHCRLLEQWRERAKLGQAEARRVTAEMLTPSGGARSNCYTFISSVTGCSQSTISKVNDQMRRTGGDREPPEHGLKKYWRKLTDSKVAPPTAACDKSSPLGASVTDDVTTQSHSSPQHTEGDEQTEQHQEQLIEQQLEQEQVLEQQQHLEHEQQLEQEELRNVVDTCNEHDLSVCVTNAVMPAATTTVSTMELESQREQLLSLQKQIMKQQLQLQQQQQLLEQQLVQQLLQQQQLQQQQQSQQLGRVPVDKTQVAPPSQMLLSNTSTSLASINPSTLSMLVPSGGRSTVQSLPSVETMNQKLLPVATDGLNHRVVSYISGQKRSVDSIHDPEQRACVAAPHVIPITVDSWHQQFFGQSSGQSRHHGYSDAATTWHPYTGDVDHRLLSEQTRYNTNDIIDTQPELCVEDNNTTRTHSSSLSHVALPSEQSLPNASFVLPPDTPKFQQLQELLLQKGDSVLRFTDNHDANKWTSKTKSSDNLATDITNCSTLPTSNAIVMNVLHSQALVQHILETSQDTANNAIGVTSHVTIDNDVASVDVIDSEPTAGQVYELVTD